TYGGNPLATAVAGKVLDIINTPEMQNGVRQRHDAFIERLNTISKEHGVALAKAELEPVYRAEVARLFDTELEAIAGANTLL
ncbi:aminotransferase class III-fold pyridoxal phosphate-dependent enzyme, partial [Salmonella enterica subsp. enterica serovar Virginia]|nr:aminotransferase class III-fold pyridoxal phosphate-dependent enzyme [Salmonella enterica subsp. enterica serovar Virginia]